MLYVVEVVTSYKVIADVNDVAGKVTQKVGNLAESRQVIGIFKDHDKALKCRHLEASSLQGDTPVEYHYVVIREIDSDF